MLQQSRWVSRAILMLSLLALPISVFAQDDYTDYTSPDGNVSFSYPADWAVLNPEFDTFAISNSENVQELVTSDTPEPVSGEYGVVMILFPDELVTMLAPDLDVNTASADDISQAVITVFTDTPSENITFSNLLDTTLPSGADLFYVNLDYGTNAIGYFTAIVGDGGVALIQGVSTIEDAAALEAVFFNMVDSATFTIPSETPAATAEAAPLSSPALSDDATYAGIPIAGEFADVREIERAIDVGNNVTRGIADNGLPYIGDLDAPIYVAEIADFSCPACLNYHPEVKTIIEGLARTGDMAFFYVPTPANSRAPYSVNAAQAAICAAQQGGFWELHDALFNLQETESIQSFTLERLTSMADGIGLNGSDLQACMETDYADTAIQAGRLIARENGANGTPTILYSLDGGETWNYIGPETGGGRAYSAIAAVVQQANEQANND